MPLYFCTDCKAYFSSESAPLPLNPNDSYVLVNDSARPAAKSNIFAEKGGKLAQTCSTSKYHYVVYVAPVTAEEAANVTGRPRISNREVAAGARGLRPDVQTRQADGTQQLKQEINEQLDKLNRQMDEKEIEDPDSFAPQNFVSDDHAALFILGKRGIDVEDVSVQEMAMLVKAVKDWRDAIDRGWGVKPFMRTDASKSKAKEFQTFNSRKGVVLSTIKQIGSNIKARSEAEKQAIQKQQQEAAAALNKAKVSESIGKLVFQPGISRMGGDNLGADFNWYRGRWRSFAVPCQVKVSHPEWGKVITVQWNQGLMVKHLREYLYRLDNAAAAPGGGALQQDAIDYINAFGQAMQAIPKARLRASVGDDDYIYSNDGAWDFLFKKESDDLICYHVLCRRKNGGAFWGEKKGAWNPSDT